MKRKSKNVRSKWTHSNFGRDNNNHRQYNAINTQLDLLYIKFISIFHNLLRNQIDSLYFCSCSFVRIYYVYILRSFNKLRPMPFKFKDIGMLTDIHYSVFADNNELRGDEDGREKKNSHFKNRQMENWSGKSNNGFLFVEYKWTHFSIVFRTTDDVGSLRCDNCVRVMVLVMEKVLFWLWSWEWTVYIAGHGENCICHCWSWGGYSAISTWYLYVWSLIMWLILFIRPKTSCERIASLIKIFSC